VARDAKQIAAIVAAACAIAAPAEGLRRVVYYDPPGIPTVCYGHTGRDVQTGKVYTDAECAALLTEDMARAVHAVEACQPGLPPKVLIAFSDAVFNMGPTIACNTAQSTAARLLRAGQFDAACNQLPRWDKARVGGQLVTLPGLTKRRAIERDLCLQWREPQSIPQL
jgi:GH24 family phage-related lysozyme (muramidase)